MKETKPAPVILLKTDRDDEWQKCLQQGMPGLDVRVWPDIGDSSTINYALLWNPPEELFDRLVNLDVIFSIGAGVDGITRSQSWPRQIPLVRLSDPLLVGGMVEYIVYSVLRIHRQMPEYERQQDAGIWKVLDQKPALDCRVGIMGLGQLGARSANALIALGYKVSGFSRRPRQLDGVECFSEGELSGFLSRLDILVCLLPLTGQTRQILNAGVFAQLSQGAAIINAGRGGHLNEMDLLESLDSGQIRHAVLDVFEHEPLPDAHPFWNHPGITLTPHIASQTEPESAVNHIIEGINLHQSGQKLKFLYNPESGY